MSMDGRENFVSMNVQEGRHFSVGGDNVLCHFREIIDMAYLSMGIRISSTAGFIFLINR